MSRASTTFIVTTIVLGLVLAKLITVAAPTIEPAHASGSSYQFETHVGSGGIQYVNIDLLDTAHLSSGEEDYSAYKDESDDRIDAWTANPSTAPTIVGRDVAVTFKYPLSGASAAALLTAVSFQVKLYKLTSSLSTEERAYSNLRGPINSVYVDNLISQGAVNTPICQGAPSHPGCFSSTTTGIIMATGRFTANGLTGLVTLRNHSDVYLVDSTGIDFIESNPQYSLATIMLPAAMWSNSSQISWP